VADFLLANAEHGKETAEGFVGCFAAAAAAASDGSFAERLLKAVRDRLQAAPIAARALAVWADSASEEQLRLIVPPLVDLLDNVDFFTNAGIIAAFRVAIRTRPIRQALAPKVSAVISKISMTPEQVQDIFYGGERRQIDVGLSMRTAAIEALLLLFNLDREFINAEVLVDALAGALGDPNASIQGRALGFLSKLAETPATSGIEHLDKAIFGEQTLDLEEAYLAFAARYSKVVAGKSHGFERLYRKYKHNPKLIRIEEDASIAFKYARTELHDVHEKSTSFKIMEKYLPEAVVILAKKTTVSSILFDIHQYREQKTK
jgi:hypothetical protein